jgi:hypothetical protein
MVAVVRVTTLAGMKVRLPEPRSRPVATAEMGVSDAVVRGGSVVRARSEFRVDERREVVVEGARSLVLGVGEVD